MGLMDSIGKTLFGQSGSDQIETLSKEQIAARNAQSQAMREAVGNSGSALAGYTASGYNPNQSQELNNFAKKGTNIMGSEMSGYARNGFNAYDQAQGRDQFSQMKGFLGSDAQKQANALSGSNFGSRFGRGGQSALGSLRDTYQKNMLGVDQAQLQAETNAKQQQYGNQIGALTSEAGANQNNFANQMSAIGQVNGANQQQYANQLQAIQQALAGNQGTLQNTNQIQNTQSTGLTQIAGGIGGIASMAGKIYGAV